MRLGEKLRYVREKLGMTQVEVAKRTSIVNSSISSFESNDREPSLGQLELLASTYHYPVSFFLLDEPVNESVVVWMKEPPEPLRQQIEAKFVRRCQQYRNLEVWLNEPRGAERALSWRSMIKKVPSSRHEVESLARNVAREMGLGDRPGEVLLRVLKEVYGVKIFHLSLEGLTTSASTFDRSFGPAILLNQDRHRWYRSMDVAVQFFYLMSWDVFRFGVNGKRAASAEEDLLALLFAYCLLMPRESMTAALEAVLSEQRTATFQQLEGIARQFDVPFSAMIRWLGVLYGEDEEKTGRFIEGSRAALAQLPARPGTTPDRYPERYIALAVKALRQGEMSPRRFAEYLEIPPSRVDEYMDVHEPEPLELSAGRA